MTHGIEEVVARGMCVGCGACNVRTSGAIPVTIGRYGVYQASLENATDAQRSMASKVCPFSDHSKNEDELAQSRFGHLPEDSKVGRYLEAFAGRIADEDKLMGSSSGGMTSFILQELLDSGEIDGVVHVGRAEGDELFGYRISHSLEEVMADRKSFYYATTLAEVLTSLRGQVGKYAIVGVPCFIKAARLLAEEEPQIAKRLKYYVGILCGHLKSQFYAESLAWQAQINPSEGLEAIDFRVKNPDRPSNRYDYSATSKAGATRTKPMGETIDGTWGYGAFQPESCNFCDDVFAETADVALGDAWLPEYRDDWRGTNVVLVRNEKISEILASAREEGRIVLDDLSVERAAETQGGNYRHRREGQSVRLADDKAEGLSVPKKRVEPGYPVTPQRVKLIRQRRAMSRLSLERFAIARKTGNLNDYVTPMRKAIQTYKRIDALGKGPVASIKWLIKILLRRP